MRPYRFALYVDGKEIKLPWEIYECVDEAIQRGRILLTAAVDTGRAKAASIAVFIDVELLGVWDWRADRPNVTWAAGNPPVGTHVRGLLGDQSSVPNA